MSSGDTIKGERWGDVLDHELEYSQFSELICSTPSNINAPWLSFEAGAVIKYHREVVFTPFLFQDNPTEIEGPLTQFQTTSFAKEDIFNLIASINNRLESETRLDLALLRRTFET
jgi:hypothetical protein